MQDDEITDALQEVGAAWLMDVDDEACQANALRHLAAAAVAAERKRWEEALRLTWRMVDPLRPAGTPGSYARGQESGIVAALTTLRANLKTPNRDS